jgi:MerR family copper efflux transcriptional regulator
MDAMNIGDAASASGVSAKMIRHYEAVGLIQAPRRTDSGYRQYGEGEVHTLRFIRQARDLGFSIHEIGELLNLWRNRRRPSRLVKALAEEHIRALEQKVQELLVMKSTLEHLVHCCHGDERPECPILDVLADGEPVVPAGRSRLDSAAIPARTRIAPRPKGVRRTDALD